MSAFRTAAFAVVLGLSITACQKQKVSNSDGTSAADAGMPTKGVDRSHKGQPAPDVAYLGPDGTEDRFSDRQGPLLVNFWATWCAPCVKELPTLDALARSQGENPAFGIITMNQDSGPQGSLEAFFVKEKINTLGLDQDPKMAVSGALGVQVLPTTILFDAQGKEVWRYVGDLDWTGEEARKLLAELPAASGKR